MQTLVRPRPVLSNRQTDTETKPDAALREAEALAFATVKQALPRLSASFTALKNEIGSNGFANLVAQADDPRLAEVLGHLKDLMILVPHLFRKALTEENHAEGRGFFKQDSPNEQQRLSALKSGLRELSAMEQHLSSPLGAKLVSRQNIEKFFDAASACIMLDWRALGGSISSEEPLRNAFKSFLLLILHLHLDLTLLPPPFPPRIPSR